MNVGNFDNDLSVQFKVGKYFNGEVIWMTDPKCNFIVDLSLLSKDWIANMTNNVFLGTGDTERVRSIGQVTTYQGTMNSPSGQFVPSDAGKLLILSNGYEGTLTAYHSPTMMTSFWVRSPDVVAADNITAVIVTDPSTTLSDTTNAMVSNMYDTDPKAITNTKTHFDNTVTITNTRSVIFPKVQSDVIFKEIGWSNNAKDGVYSSLFGRKVVYLPFDAGDIPYVQVSILRKHNTASTTLTYHQGVGDFGYSKSNMGHYLFDAAYYSHIGPDGVTVPPVHTASLLEPFCINSPDLRVVLSSENITDDAISLPDFIDNPSLTIGCEVTNWRRGKVLHTSTDEFVWIMTPTKIFEYKINSTGSMVFSRSKSYPQTEHNAVVVGDIVNYNTFAYSYDGRVNLMRDGNFGYNGQNRTGSPLMFDVDTSVEGAANATNGYIDWLLISPIRRHGEDMSSRLHMLRGSDSTRAETMTFGFDYFKSIAKCSDDSGAIVTVVSSRHQADPLVPDWAHWVYCIIEISWYHYNGDISFGEGVYASVIHDNILAKVVYVPNVGAVNGTYKFTSIETLPTGHFIIQHTNVSGTNTFNSTEPLLFDHDDVSPVPSVATINAISGTGKISYLSFLDSPLCFNAATLNLVPSFGPGGKMIAIGDDSLALQNKGSLDLTLITPSLNESRQYVVPEGKVHIQNTAGNFEYGSDQRIQNMYGINEISTLLHTTYVGIGNYITIVNHHNVAYRKRAGGEEYNIDDHARLDVDVGFINPTVGSNKDYVCIAGSGNMTVIPYAHSEVINAEGYLTQFDLTKGLRYIATGLPGLIDEVIITDNNEIVLKSGSKLQILNIGRVGNANVTVDAGEVLSTGITTAYPLGKLLLFESPIIQTHIGFVYTGDSGDSGDTATLVTIPVNSNNTLGGMVYTKFPFPSPTSVVNGYLTKSYLHILYDMNSDNEILVPYSYEDGTIVFGDVEDSPIHNYGLPQSERLPRAVSRSGEYVFVYNNELNTLTTFLDNGNALIKIDEYVTAHVAKKNIWAGYGCLTVVSPEQTDLAYMQYATNQKTVIRNNIIIDNLILASLRSISIVDNSTSPPSRMLSANFSSSQHVVNMMLHDLRIVSNWHRGSNIGGT